MKILKSWLKDFVDIKESDQEVADLLTFSGTLVEDIVSSLDSKVIVAKILEVNPHPNADKLRLAIVDTGKEKLNIVCGAPNIEAGQLVPLALIGAKIGDFEIKEAVIRGEHSYGMLCSEKELSLGDDHSGIKILPDYYKIGEPLNTYLKADSVFDLEITANRGDCLSHIGIAREFAAVTKKELKFSPDKIDHQKNDFSVSILNPAHCNRYFAILIKGVKIAPSPEWLRQRLEALGQSSINNVVDITNYVMYGLGQPLHAFDAKKLQGKRIIVRNAKDGETITSIDGEVRHMDKEMLVIADEKNPIAIAGVMGGYDSEIDENTTEIVLEAAEFERKSIRRTAKELKLNTEASYRFERGIDPDMVEVAGDEAAKLILELAGGEIIGKVSDIAHEYENEWINLPYKKINKLLGTDLSNDEINDILKRLNFKFKNDMCQAPAYRHDVSIWQDLAEEVARIYGFANIKYSELPKTAIPKKSSYYLKEYIKDILADLGFIETFGYAFLSEADIKAIGLDQDDLLEVANPIQPENKYMRKSLLPGLLKTVAKNPTFDPVLIFEIGDVFDKENEKTNLAIVASGKGSQKILAKALEVLSEKIKLSKSTSFLFDELKKEDLIKFKIKKPLTYTLEIDFSKIEKSAGIDLNTLTLNIPQKKIHYRPVSKYPSITRDVAFIIDDKIAANEIVDLIYNQSELIIRAELFDEFVSDKFGAGKKNLAFHIDLQHQERTLTDKEADEVIEKIITTVKEKFGGEIRNY